MKKVLAGILCVTILMSTAIVASADVKKPYASLNRSVVLTQKSGSQYTLKINNTSIDLKKLEIVKVNSKVMVPLEITSKALGFNVTSNKEKKTVHVKGDNLQADLTIGLDIYCVYSSKAAGMTAPKGLGVSPTMMNGVVYVPVDFYKILLMDDNCVSIKGNVVSISAKSLIKVDTGSQLAIQPGKTYQFKITSNIKPAFSVGNKLIIKLVSNKSSGNTYYFTIQAVGKAGQSSGVYVNGTRVTVCTIEKNAIQIPNPLVNYKTLDEARKAVGFSFAVPTNLPTNYEMKDIIVISNNLAEIFYKKDNQEILYRAAKGNADISGNYTVYEEVKTVTVGSAKVTVKGKSGLINLATWTKDGISYSLDFDEACDLKSVSSIIESLK